MFILAEIQLEIYSYLLVAAPSRLKTAVQKKESVKGVTLQIDYVSPHHPCYKNKKTTVFKQTSAGLCASIGLTPQILRVCKAIHRDATPILYGENVFQFRLKEGQTPSNRGSTGLNDFESFCRELRQDPMGRWIDEAPDALRDSTFAVFLRKIGQRNAASIKKLKFVEEEAHKRAYDQQAGRPIQAITHLLKSHVPDVRQVKICRGCDHWDGFEDGPFKPVDFEPERLVSSCRVISCWDELPDLVPDVRRGEQEAMYKATADLVREITWLKQLSVTGFDEDDPAYQKLEDLQTLVKTRR